jgi:hypothetical protein
LAGLSGNSIIEIAGSANIIDQVADYHFHKFALLQQTSGSGPNYLIQVGSEGGNYLSGFKKNSIDNFTFSGGDIAAVRFCQAHLAKLDKGRISATDAAGVERANWVGILFDRTESGVFTGGIDVVDVQIAAPGNSGGLLSGGGAKINSTINSPLPLAGIKFEHVTFYGGRSQIEMVATGGGLIADIIVDDLCEFEGPSLVAPNAAAITRAVSMFVNHASSRIANVSISPKYISGHGFYQGIHSEIGLSGGSILLVSIKDVMIANPVKEAVKFLGANGACRSISVTNVRVNDSGNTGANSFGMYFEGVSQIITSNNMLTGTLPSQDMTAFIQHSGAGTYRTAVGNNASGLAAASVGFGSANTGDNASANG